MELKSKARWLAALFGAGVLLVAVLVLSGVLRPPGTSYTQPPCEQLPSRNTVDQALAHRADVVESIKHVGSQVNVAAASVCEPQDRALIRITYLHDRERLEIEKILMNPTFGVPVELAQED
ncbi:hypothetical protein SAMN05421595_2720 [Austwickia chelonae]|uniref:Uncharacterized protein n=1 Tax=Austwickia chelonae NBRC 105200 TaxID=1184607 RepID=K6V8A2_9MICO|nr:hypothetical protein [Austwickia chelonae]GAB78453.1 hypothetical protein AUCHE_09_00590 [Austwickia chelonae NBRC 105200]SEW39709.1 hypothetical protein SAMN05421595_2720 [Austwickia chelonae]